MSADRLRELVRAEHDSLTALRHDLHSHPELSYQERRTSAVVQRELSALGVEFRAGLAGGTGVIGHLPATSPGTARAAVALRADMDALPITEATGRAYSSLTPGVMHACGHDGHTSILLGAARVLARWPDRPNPVTFIFQPAEEGGGGADRLCSEGVMEGAAGGGLGPKVGRIFGLHGWPQLEEGLVASRPGPLLAATDDFDVRIVGSGGHAAYPHLCRDPIVAGSAVVTALQAIASRAVAPFDSVVCTVGQFQAGTANNIIPDSARLVGTVRTLTPEVRRLAKDRFHEIVLAAARTHGCSAEIAWHEGYPVTANDAAETERFFGVARSALGADRVRRVDHATMGGEDFSYYGRHAPACFFFLGLKPPGAASFPGLHQPDFDFPDSAIPTGVEMMCRLALSA